MFFDQFLEYMRLGGSIMWIILAMSIIAAAVVIERIIFFCLSSENPERLEAEFANFLEAGRSGPDFAVRGKSSLRRLFSTASQCWEQGDEKLSLRLEGEIRRELYRWGRNLQLLEVVTRSAPLLGLLGTVLGMVEMFGSMSVGGAVDARAVTGGIWKALFTTVAGLAVAIPVLAAHGFLTGAISREEETLERGVDFIMARRPEGRGF